MPNTFHHKSYCVTIDEDDRALADGVGGVRGTYSIWKLINGVRGKQIYRGRTAKTFKLEEVEARVRATESEARAWIDRNEGKPWA